MSTARVRRVRTIVCVAFVAGASVTNAREARAFKTSGCKWSSVPIAFANQGTDKYTQIIADAIASYNQLGGALITVATEPAAKVTVTAANYGNIAVDGAFVRRGTAFADPACANGFWTGGDAEIVFNSYYGDVYDAARIRSVYAHEIGHSVGLAHNNTTVPCTSGFRAAESIMHEATSIRSSGPCAIAGPLLDDKNGLRSLYAAGK